MKFFVVFFLGCGFYLQAELSAYDTALKELGTAYTHVVTGSPVKSLPYFNKVFFCDSVTDDEKFALMIIGSFGKSLAYDLLKWNAQAEEMVRLLESYVEVLPEENESSFGLFQNENYLALRFFDSLTEFFASDQIKNSLFNAMDQLHPIVIYQSKFVGFLRNQNFHQYKMKAPLRFCGKTWNKCLKIMNKIVKGVEVVGAVIISGVATYVSVKTMLNNLDYQEQKCAIELDSLRKHLEGSSK